MTPWRRRVRRARLLLQAAFALGAIVLALLVGLTQLALPWIVSHPERVSAFLSERVGRPVRIDRVDGNWESTGPLLRLNGVHIGAASPQQQPLVIQQAELKVDFFSFFWRHYAWNEFRLVGLELTLERDAGGAWQLRGLGGSGADGGDPSSALLDLGALVLKQVRVHVDDAQSGRHLLFGSDEVRLINSGSTHRLIAQVRCLDTLSTPVDVVLEYDSEDRSGEVYLGSEKLDFAALMRGYGFQGVAVSGGSGRAQMWTWWRRGKLQRARVEADLSDLVLDAATPIALQTTQRVAPRTALSHLAFGARWQRSEEDWQLDIADLRLAYGGTETTSGWMHLEKQQGTATFPTYAFVANRVDLGALASIAMLSDKVDPMLRQWLYAANPGGALDAVALRYVSAHDFDVSASAAGLSWHAFDKFPGSYGISGTLLGDQDALALTLPEHAASSVDYPHVFRRALEFSQFAGTLVAYRTDAAWRIETERLSFDGEGYGGELRGAVEIPDDGTRPLLDVYAALDHADVVASHLFWPINTMPSAAVLWLDRALASGRVSQGRVAFRGDLDDWPFRNLAGRFQARAVVEDLRLAFLPDWPAAEHVAVVADFVNTGLHVEASAGELAGNKVDNATADIADLGEPMLQLSAGGAGAGRDLLGLMRATPIGQRFGAQLLGVDLGGQGKVDLQLHLPIKHAEQLKLTGSATLADADLSDAKYNLHFAKASGKVRFSEGGFSADDLGVRVDGQVASFGLAVGAFCVDSRHAAEAALSGNLSARTLITYAPVLDPYADRVSGNADWNIAFSVDGDAPGAQHLTLTSDLRGVSVDLPAPMRKAADSAWPLRLTLELPFAGGKLDMRVADLVHLHGRLPTSTQPFAAAADFGTETVTDLPTRGIAIAGNAPQLDVSGWMDFAVGSSTGTGSLIASVDLKAQGLMAFGREFADTAFTLTAGKDTTDLGFHGAAVDGTLHVPTSDVARRGVTAQFDRLYWPEAPEPAAASSIETNPAVVPPLHFWIGDFHLGEANYGEARMESYPIADGMRIDKVETHSPNVEMNAHGDWIGRIGRDRSHFAIELTAQSLGRMLDALGYAGVVEGGQTVAHIDAVWNGAPSTFALARLDGTLKVSVAQGRILEVDPGAGRLFGLLSLRDIPRRLSLDFSDLFKSGFSFDSINGLFTLKEGNAVTENLEVKSPTADIRINGRTGLRQKDYDQDMEVTPHVGGTLAVGGGLVGGPIGAAAGVLLQSVFHNQINAAARAHYRVTGNWDKPVITLLAKETVKPKPAKDGAAPASGGVPRSGFRS